MYAKATRKSFWSQMIVVLTIMMLVLTAMPIQSARADTAGFTAPSIYSNSTLLNPGNAYLSDNVYVQSNGNNKSAEYSNFGFNIPAGAAINLVEVSIEGHGNKNWKVSVSKNNGVSYSASTTITNTGTDTVTVTGGMGTLWGLTGWTASSLNNANFRVKIASAGGSSANIAYLDQLKVRVTYTPVSSAPTTLVLTPLSHGTYGGTVSLQATLTSTSSGLPLSGKVVSFTLDGFPKGTATTDANGIATLSGVALTTGLSSTMLNVGTYNVEATFSGDSSYAFSTDTDSQVINPRAISVTANAQSKTYGTNDPTLTYLFAPSLIGSDIFSGTLTRNAGENAGSYAITQGTLTLGNNYAITYVGANLTVTPLAITVTADNKAMHTGDSEPSYTFSVSQFVGSDSFTTSPICLVTGAHTTAGTYPIVCSGGNAGSNYSINYTDGTLTVTDKVILTVTADLKTITYGEADPQFTFTYSGFVDGDTDVTGTDPTCSVAGSHTNAGSYPSITCAGGVDVKYAFSYVSGTLTVNRLAVTVTANAQSKSYGADDPALTYLFAPSLVGSDSFSGTLTRNASESVGSYAITQGTLNLGANYTITYVGANLTINKASLTVIANDQTIGFGVPDPSFTFEYEGFVHGEDSSVIDAAPTCGVSGAHTALGTYSIICSGGSDNSYSFSFVNGTLAVIQNQVNVVLGTADQGSYSMGGNQGLRVSYDAVNDGPVKVASTTGIPIVAAERVIYRINGVPTSFTEMMGLPDNQLDDTYWMPWYNNVDLDTQLRFGNVSDSTATIHVYIHDVEVPGSPFVLAPGASTRQSFAGVNNGPVRIVSDVNIVAAERLIYKVNGVPVSFSEMMGLPDGQLNDTYWMPWYNNVDLDTQLRFGNVSTSTATVHVYIGDVEMPGSPFILAPGASTRQSFAGVNNGPVKIKSDVNIVAAERLIYKVNGVPASFSEMMGLPESQLNTTYWMPWYNNVDLDTQLRFGIILP